MKTLAALAALTVATPALAADTMVAVDVDAVVDHAGDAGNRQLAPELGAFGTGVTARLGRAYRLPFVQLIPEVGGSMVTVQGDQRFRTFAGARLSVGKIITPTVYGHLGYHFGSAETSGGFSPDVGVALDIRPMPVLSFGIHAQHTFDGRGTSAIGGHLTATF